MGVRSLKRLREVTHIVLTGGTGDFNGHRLLPRELGLKLVLGLGLGLWSTPVRKLFRKLSVSVWLVQGVKVLQQTLALWGGMKHRCVQTPSPSVHNYVISNSHYFSCSFFYIQLLVGKKDGSTGVASGKQFCGTQERDLGPNKSRSKSNRDYTPR